MPQQMIALFNDQQGSLMWTLPPEAAEALRQAPKTVQVQILEAFGNNIGVFCAALLQTFDNPAKVEVLNMMMLELKELVDT